MFESTRNSRQDALRKRITATKRKSRGEWIRTTDFLLPKQAR